MSQATENLGLSMVYTLVTSAKEWLSERYCQDPEVEDAKELESKKDEVLFISLVYTYLSVRPLSRLSPLSYYWLCNTYEILSSTWTV